MYDIRKLGVEVTRKDHLLTITYKGKSRELYDAPWMFSGVTDKEWVESTKQEIIRVVDDMNDPTDV